MGGLIQSLGIDLTEAAGDNDTTDTATQSSGADLSSSVKLGSSEVLQDGDNNTENKKLSAAGNVAAGVSTFVVAYAVHKVFAPLRIGITLSVVPFVVRYYRRTWKRQ